MGEGHLTNSITHNLLGSGEIRGERIQFWMEKVRGKRIGSKGLYKDKIKFNLALILIFIVVFIGD